MQNIVFMRQWRQSGKRLQHHNNTTNQMKSALITVLIDILPMVE